jgi:cystathionine gamma-synthase
MKCGYPRFVYHPYVIQLMNYFTTDYNNNNNNNHQKQDCLVLPTRHAAERCQAFMRQALNTTTTTINNSHNSSIHIASHAGIHAVLFPAETPAAIEAKAYWQHTGELVSSRRAEMALKELNIPLKHVTLPGTSLYSADAVPITDTTMYTQLQHSIGTWTNTTPDAVHLVASGMASIYTALRMARKVHQDKNTNNQTSTTLGDGGTSIVFGFPYLDTLKLCSRAEFCPGGVEFFGRGDDYDIQKLEEFLEKMPPGSCSVLFTEIPSNPLLLTPNFEALRALATKHQFALVVDDTIGNYANVHLLGPNGADAVCTSLTKLVSGRGDAMAGALVLNQHTPMGRTLQATMQSHQEPSTLFPADAWAIYHNSRDFLERNARINHTAERLADYLSCHAHVESVYYPKYTAHYRTLCHPSSTATTPGYGGLFSIVLGSHMCPRTFFDALDISKGPSLGTNFTLMCPYTLLAHYHELDFCLAYNVQPNLLRIAVGLEDYDVLKSKFDRALTASKLHPPLPKQQRREYSTMLVGRSGGMMSQCKWRRFGRLCTGMALVRKRI